MHKKIQDSAQCPPAQVGDYLTRGETLEVLQVKLQTLYAYVSRGLIRSVPQGSNGRRLYARQDVEKMKSRADARSGHAPVAAAAMRWGEPIIQSTITQISPDGPMYRGVSAVDLARAGITFEEVAGRLWKTGASGVLSWQPCQHTVRFAEAYASMGWSIRAASCCAISRTSSFVLAMSTCATQSIRKCNWPDRAG